MRASVRPTSGLLREDSPRLPLIHASIPRKTTATKKPRDSDGPLHPTEARFLFFLNYYYYYSTQAAHVAVTKKDRCNSLASRVAEWGRRWASPDSTHLVRTRVARRRGDTRAALAIDKRKGERVAAARRLPILTRRGQISPSVLERCSDKGRAARSGKTAEPSEKTIHLLTFGSMPPSASYETAPL